MYVAIQYALTSGVDNDSAVPAMRRMGGGGGGVPEVYWSPKVKEYFCISKRKKEAWK